MTQAPKQTSRQQTASPESPPIDPEVDPTRICWTQLLRETEAEFAEPLKRTPLPDDFDPEKLFT